MAAFDPTYLTIPDNKYATSANEMPKFMQDAIYDQITRATTIANNPYQEYQGQTVASQNQDTLDAYNLTRQNVGSWQPALDTAMQGMAAIGGAPAQAAAAQPYLNQVAGMSGLANAQPALAQQTGVLNSLNLGQAADTLNATQNQYTSPELANSMLQQGQNFYGAAGTIDIAGAASPYLQNAAGLSGVAAAQPALGVEAQMLGNINYAAPVTDLTAQQSKYLSPELAASTMQTAQNALGAAGSMDVAGAASPYFQQAAGMSGLEAAKAGLGAQADLLSNLNYNAPTENLAAAQGQYLSPELAQSALAQSQQAYNVAGGIDVTKAASPYMAEQAAALQGIDYNAAVNNLNAAQSKYLSPELAQSALAQSQKAYNVAGGMDIAAAANPLLQQQIGALNALNINAPVENLEAKQNQYLQPDLAARALQTGQAGFEKAAGLSATEAASPYLQQAAQTSAAGVQQYMSPYQQAVTDQIAKLGARNLSENLLPAVSDAFIRSGQFGGSRMGEFGSRALRDVGESVLAQQAQALQQGYGQALTASQSDLARQAQLASTAGQLTGQQQSALTNIGQAQTAAGQAQQQTGLSAAQTIANAQQQAQANQLQIASQLGAAAGQTGQLTAQQLSAMTNLGQAQASLGQAQQQSGLAAAQQTSAAQQQAASQALQGAAQYGQLAGQAGQLTGQQAANMLNLGQAQASMGQAQQQAGLNAAQQIAASQAQGLSQAQASAAQFGQLGVQTGQLSAEQQKLLAQLGTSAGQLTGQQQSALTNIGQIQANISQQQQQAGLNAANQVAAAQQQAIAQNLQGASAYGQMGSQLGALTQQQQQALTNIGQTAGQLTGQQMSALTALGQAQTGAGQAQQQAGLTAAQNLAQTQQQASSQALQQAGQYGALGSTIGGLTADQQRILAGVGTSAAGFAGADQATQMSALSNIASLAGSAQALSAKDAAALEAIGTSQQAQQQQELNAAYQQYKEQQQYPMQMADWLSTQVRGMAPITPQITTRNEYGQTVVPGTSPLAQIAGLGSLVKATVP